VFEMLGCSYYIWACSTVAKLMRCTHHRLSMYVFSSSRSLGLRPVGIVGSMMMGMVMGVEGVGLSLRGFLAAMNCQNWLITLGD
jgi:hypothetical protein